MKKYIPWLIFSFILLAGFIFRIFLVERVIVGDLLSFGEWGKNIWDTGFRNFYFGKNIWTYSVPNYTPLSYILFGGLYWLFEHKYWLAQLHNIIKIPPAAFIVYFYKYGYILLLKLPVILADLGLGVIIYNLLMLFTKNRKKAVVGMALFVLNPITIFLSGAWGQTDSLVALLGLGSFILLAQKRVAISLPLLFISLWIKPTWTLFLPLYIFLLFEVRPKLRSLVKGILISLAIFIASTYPYSGPDFIRFSNRLVFERVVMPLRVVGKASVSAFNFHTIFLRVDRDFPTAKIAGISSRNLGLLAYLFLNLISFSYIRKQKNILWATIVGIYVIGLGSFIFMANMLERYFFPGLAPLIVIMMTDIKTLLYGVFVNLVLFANIIWSFYRRGSDEIDHPFTNNNFALIRVLSVFIVSSWLIILPNLKRLRPHATI